MPLLAVLCLWAPLLGSLTSAASPVLMELWCVAKNNAEDTALRTALDWACGQGGADCGPIQQGGPCYDPTDVQSMASFAFNSYFLKNSMADHSCFFDNNAALTSLNPSHDKCKFPSSSAVSNGSTVSPSTASSVGLGPSQDMSAADDRFAGRYRFLSLFLSNVLLFSVVGFLH